MGLIKNLILFFYLLFFYYYIFIYIIIQLYYYFHSLSSTPFVWCFIWCIYNTSRKLRCTLKGIRKELENKPSNLKISTKKHKGKGFRKSTEGRAIWSSSAEDEIFLLTAWMIKPLAYKFKSPKSRLHQKFKDKQKASFISIR